MIGRKAWFARIALGLILAGGPTLCGPARAQIGQGSLTLNGRTFALSPIELDRLTAIAHVVQTSDRGAQDRALDAARSVANSPDSRYVLAIYQLEIGRRRRDDALRAPALDVLIADRETPADRLPGYLAVRGDIAFRARDYATASTLWGRLLELQPGDPQNLMNLANVRAAQQDEAGAVDLIRRAIAAPHTGPVPEAWYLQWLSIVYNGHLLGQTADAGHALVSAYPTPANWRHALVAYRQLAAPQGNVEIDLLRLMRTAGALTQAQEYQRLAQLLEHGGLAVEGMAVLDDGVARGVVDGTQSPTPDIRREIDTAIRQQRARPPASPLAAADTLFAEGHFAEAAAAYQALQQGRAERGAVTIRLAAALARAGRRAEAETALRRLAADGEAPGAARFYADLARFWLDWLAASG